VCVEGQRISFSGVPAFEASLVCADNRASSGLFIDAANPGASLTRVAPPIRRALEFQYARRQMIQAGERLDKICFSPRAKSHFRLIINL